MKKIEGNSKKANFTKLTQKGISLIVLVITIIIIVILSTAILVSVVSNNPVMEANKARYESDTANMQAIFTNTVAKIMSQNRASIEIRPGRVNEFVSGINESVGEVHYTVIDAMDINNTTGTIYFDKGTNTNTEFYTGRKLPIYSAGETKWYVDAEGNISLEVAGVKYGNGETIVLEGEGQTYHTFAPSTLSFRSTADLEDFKEVKINGETIDPSNYTLTEGSTIVTLSIDYLKTLDVDKHEITIVSKNAAPTAKFEVVEPEVNEYNFYYNQPYSAYVPALGGEKAFLLRENGTVDVIDVVSTLTETGTFTCSNNVISITISIGTLTGVVSDNGKEIYCNELGVTAKLGSNSIVADEEYIYAYDDYLGGYKVTPIDKTKSVYGIMKNGINGKETVRIANNAFKGNKNLLSLPYIPSTVTSIGECAFLGCASLTEVVIPDGINAIEYSVFEKCINLKRVTIPSSVTQISGGAFMECTSLESITIPSSVIIFDNSMFYNCINLSTIRYEGTMAKWTNLTSELSDWKYNVPATEVKCSDGVVPLK